ncbi:hypothetical protein ACTFIU_009456 [Dictyostelium citrinum]
MFENEFYTKRDIDNSKKTKGGLSQATIPPVVKDQNTPSPNNNNIMQSLIFKKLEATIQIKVFISTAYSTGFNENIYPNGCYSENIRYIFSDVIGRPIDPSKTPKPNKPYYYPSCDFLEKIFIDREFDLYQKEFRRVEFTHSDNKSILDNHKRWRNK